MSAKPSTRLRLWKKLGNVHSIETLEDHPFEIPEDGKNKKKFGGFLGSVRF
ncbi:hypothetical protein COCNU_scaffold004872G000060 [Cocos nucifera]|nr:hypothetical protein [Cocos nucifera]